MGSSNKHKHQKCANKTMSLAASSGLSTGEGWRLSKESIGELKTVSEIALSLVAMAGVVAVSVVAPNLLQLIPKARKFKQSFRKLSPNDKRKKITQTFYYLRRSGLVKFEESPGGFLLSLTALGKSRLPKLNMDSLTIKKPRSWDGHWWMVAGDIPTKNYRQAADQLRQKLKDMGFYPLQRTLWLYPFNPVKELQFILAQFGIERFVTIMEIVRLDKEDGTIAGNHFKKLGIL